MQDLEELARRDTAYAALGVRASLAHFVDTAEARDMPHSRTTPFRRYLLGLASTFAGAGLVDVTGSLWPLALGGACSLMCTAPLVVAIWSGRR